jgi:plasmid stability protein
MGLIAGAVESVATDTQDAQHRSTAMADVKIRKLDDWVVASFRARAKHAGRSLEEELRQFLTEAARERRQRFIAELDELNARLREKYGELPDSTPLIREERDRYG